MEVFDLSEIKEETLRVNMYKEIIKYIFVMKKMLFMNVTPVS